jgi:hypothetical protein
MKKLFLKIIGLDEKTLSDLKKQVVYLQITVENLQNIVNKDYETHQKIIDVLNDFKINPKNVAWWENNNRHYDDEHMFNFAENIKVWGKIETISKYPSIKQKLIFHGACLKCNKPLEIGCGICLRCEYTSRD